MAKNSKAKDVIGVILGEAKAGDYRDMLGVASVIANRAAQLGVTPEDVISAMSGSRKQFDAYNTTIPAGNEKYADLAAQAWEQVNTLGPVHNATFFATPNKVDNLPNGLEPVDETEGHQYFHDPAGRNILTAQGYKTPDIAVTAQALAKRSTTIDNIAGLVAPAAEGLFAQAPGILGDTYTQPSSEEMNPVDVPGSRPGPLVNTDMNPLLSSLDGSARLTREGALENMSGVLAKNYEAMSDHYGLLTGKDLPAINDGIAKIDTGRENPRSPDYNPGSFHFQGRALDFGISDLSDFEKQALDQAAKVAGFTGIGYDSSIMHVDDGPRRSWSYGNRTFAGIPMADAKASVHTGESLLPENTPAPFAPTPTRDPRKTDQVAPPVMDAPLASSNLSQVGPIAASMAPPGIDLTQGTELAALSPPDLTRTWGPNAGIVQSMPEQETQPTTPQDDYTPLEAPVTNLHSNFSEQGFIAPGSYQRSATISAPSIANAVSALAPPGSTGGLLAGTAPQSALGFEAPGVLSGIADQATDALTASNPGIPISSQTPPSEEAPTTDFTFNGVDVSEPVPSTVAPSADDTFAEDPDIDTHHSNRVRGTAGSVIGLAAPDEKANSTRERGGILGPVIGGLLGGAVLGPVGGILGATLGRAAQDKGVFGSISEGLQSDGLSSPFSGMQAPGQWMGGNYSFNPGFSTNKDSAIDPNTGWTTHTNEHGVTTITGGIRGFPEDAQPMVSNAGIGGGPGAGKGG